MTPAEIVVELDQHIVGQLEAKRALAIALRNRYRRRQLPYEQRRDILPKNIMMIGPTGVGKTEMVRRVASMLQAPFLKVEATKYTEVGYVGRDVESIAHDLVEDTVARLHDRRLQEVHTKAEQRATDRLVDYIVAQAQAGSIGTSTGRISSHLARALRSEESLAHGSEEPVAQVDAASRRRIGRLVRSQKLDDAMVEIEVTPEVDPYDPYWDYGTGEGGEPYREPPAPRVRPRARTVCIRDAKRILAREEANKLVDFDAVVDEALERVEESGIVFIDELDKVAGHGREAGADVSGEGVQRDLLPIVEGSIVMTRYGPVSTHHVLFIAAGSFTRSKPSDLIPELQGRFPLRVELKGLDRTDLEDILVRPKSSLCAQYQALLSTEGVKLTFTPDGVAEVARIAWELNQRLENIGARRLHTVLEQVLEDVSFHAADMAGSAVVVDAGYVRERTATLMRSEDLSKFIL
jgi:ATP-dependent HslUV protease ATP-binding subunit HslU